MQTYSHALITFSLHRAMRRRGIQADLQAFVAGAVAPDLPLFVLTLGYVFYYAWLRPSPREDRFSRYDALYFHNPIWIVGHNLFHAPINLCLLMIVGSRAAGRKQPWGARMVWFVLGCLFHTLLDVFTHHHDGPLLLFPVNWQARFRSPVSYWDRRHHGRLFALVEHVIDLAILAGLGVNWWRKRSSQTHTKEE